MALKVYRHKKPYVAPTYPLRVMRPDMRATKVIWVEGDDGTVDLGSIPGVSQQDIFQAAIVVTDAGRILKNRYGEANKIIASFDLVKTAEKKKVKATPSKYRSIYEPSDIKEDL